MTTSNPDTTSKAASGPANGSPPATGAPQTPGAASAAEPTLKERSSELAAVARAEQAKLRAREKERAERVALEARAKAAEEKAQRLAELEERIAKDPLGLLSERGVKARDIAERVVKEGTPDAKLEELSAKYQKLVEEREAERKWLEEQVQAEEGRKRYEAARKQLHTVFNEVNAECPLLSKICTTEARTEREYMAAWTVIQSDPQLASYPWTDAEVFREMEKAKAIDRDVLIDGTDADVLEKALTNKRTSATGTEKASSGSVRQGTENASGSGAKTLTNGQAASRQSADEEFDIRPGETLAQADARQNRILTERLRQRGRG